MAKFAQYAVAATKEALEDAGWKPTRLEEQEATVRTELTTTMETLAEQLRVFV